jgi:hypothetical protein
MRRHSTDLVGLMFGSAFLIAGVGFLVRETTDAVVNPAWMTGLGLMLLGAIALVATIARTLTGDRDEHAAATVPLPVTPDEPVTPFSSGGLSSQELSPGGLSSED